MAVEAHIARAVNSLNDALQQLHLMAGMDGSIDMHAGVDNLQRLVLSARTDLIGPQPPSRVTHPSDPRRLERTL